MSSHRAEEYEINIRITGTQCRVYIGYKGTEEDVRTTQLAHTLKVNLPRRTPYLFAHELERSILTLLKQAEIDSPPPWG